MASRLEAQNPDSDFGKILKIDLRTSTKSHVSIGHRNPQGLTITASGAMYATEHGPQGGDELNLIVPGKNYGWPIETYGAHYGKYDWPVQTRNAKAFERPVLAWVPSIGVSNLIELENFHPAWNGDLLVESLKAQSLFRLRRDGDGRVV
jgi:glucose/arabinose dehydrogenase